MRIATVFTGGTILSEEKSGWFSIDEKNRLKLLNMIPKEFDAESFSPYIIHSEQLDGSYLTALINEVGKLLNKQYEGIVVFHGTDTLQYSAAALSLAYGNTDIPVVFVSANFVLDDKRSNGADNLKYALEFIKLKIGGVFVSYKNKGENPSIHLGHTLLEFLPYSDRLFSLNSPYACFENDKFICLSDRIFPEAKGKYSLSKNSPVLRIRAAAGMTMPQTDNYKAVLIETYHSGTLPTESEVFKSFCKKCKIPVYIVGVNEGKNYESAKSYEQLNLNILPPISPVFAYIMLWQKYS